jgi:hypothetical protein
MSPKRRVALEKRCVSGSKIVERVPNCRFWADKEGCGIISDHPEEFRNGLNYV